MTLWLALWTALAAPVWEQPPLEGSPTELLEAASEAFPGDGGTLWRHVTVRIDEGGRTERSTHEIMQVRDPDHLPPIAWGYAPWHQDPPVIQARVIHPDGTTTTLDRSTEVEQVIGDSGNRILTDTRVIRYDMPEVEAGALIEWTIEEAQHRPFMGEAASGRERIGGTMGRLHAGRFEIHSPKTVPFNYQLNEVDPTKVKVRTRKGVRQLRVDVEQVNPVASTLREARWVNDPARWLEYSTFESWGTVREAYSKLVDPLYDPEGATALLQPKPEGDRLQRIRIHLDTVNDAIRYTGIEFGHQSIVPYAPKTVCDRGFGDCKDQATLLASLLRHDGIEAYVALLQAGYDAEDPKPLANPTHFNHAIVYVPGDEPIWLDPTSPVAAVGSLPLSDQERYALVIGPGFDDLVRTPTTVGTTHYTLRYDMRAQPVTLTVEVQHDGWSADFDRWGLRESQAPAETVITERASASWGDRDVTGTTVTGVHRHSGPFTMRYHMPEFSYRTGSSSESFPSKYRVISAQLDSRDVLSAASYSGTSISDDTLVRVDPRVLEHTIEIVAGPGFGLVPASEGQFPLEGERSFGAISIRRSVEAIEDGWSQRTTVEVSDGRVTLGQLREAMEAVDTLRDPEVAFGTRHDQAADDPVLRLKTAAAAFESASDHPVMLENWTSLLTQHFYPDEALRLLDEAAARGIDTPGLQRVRTEVEGVARIGAEAPPLPLDDLLSAPLGDLDNKLAWNAGMRRLRTLTDAIPPFTANPEQGARLVEMADLLHEDGFLGLGVRRDLRRQLLNIGAYERILDTPDDPDESWVSPAQDAVWLVARTLHTGVDDASAALQDLPEDDRWNIAHDAAVILTRLRRYDASRAILEAGRRFAPDALNARAMIDEFAPLAPWSERFDAKGPMGDLSRALFVQQRGILRRAAMPAKHSLAWEERTVRDSAVWLLHADDVPVDTAIDWIIAQTDVTLESVADVHRIRAKGLGRRPVAIYMAGSGADARILGTSSQPSHLGRHAVGLLDAGKVDEARTVLAWAETHGSARDSTLQPYRDAFKQADTSSVDDLRTLGWMLASVLGGADALTALDEAAPASSEGLHMSVGDTLARGWLYAGDLPQALAAVDRWPMSDEEDRLRERLDILRESGRHDEADALLDGWSNGDKGVITFERSMVALARGDVDRAMAPALDDYDSSGRTSSLVTVVRVLLHGGRPKEAAERARTLLEEPVLVDDHYLAAAEALAQVGDWAGVAEALSRTHSEHSEISADWWYIVGRVADAAGMTELAASCDARVPNEPWRAMSAHKLLR